jgi:hypothetical protein
MTETDHTLNTFKLIQQESGWNAIFVEDIIYVIYLDTVV